MARLTETQGDLFLLWKNLVVEQDILYGILEIIKFKILMKIVLHVTLESFHTLCVPVESSCHSYTQEKNWKED